jgi:ParB/RepB/Spo0J family partition protein
MPPRPKRKSTQPVDPKTVMYQGGTDKSGDLLEVPIASLCPNPFNRRTMQGVEELAETIRQVGLLQPISHIGAKLWLEVYPETEEKITAENVILFGEHRWRAMGLAGHEKIDSFLRDDWVKDARVITLIENVRRSQLSLLEEAEHYKELYASGMSYERIAQSIGETADGAVSKGTVWKRVQLLSLGPEALEELRAGRLRRSAAEKLVALEDPDEQRAGLALILDGVHPVEAQSRVVAARRPDPSEDAPEPAGSAHDDTDGVSTENGSASTASTAPAPVSNGNGSGAAVKAPAARKAPASTASADRAGVERAAAASEREAACLLLIGTVDLASADGREAALQCLTAATLGPQQTAAVQQRAFRWLNESGHRNVDAATPGAYFDAVQESGDGDLRVLAAFACALAAVELRTAARKQSWTAREREHVAFLQQHAGYVPQTDWEKRAMGLASVGGER